MDTRKEQEPKNPTRRSLRAYERPAIHWEEDFEPYVFSTCGKMPGQGGGCGFHNKS